MSALLEDYAMIGDCESAALVCKTGSIDWLCWPRFDSDACFAALIGESANGQWLLAPMDCDAQCVSRRYREDTLIVETDFADASGAMRIIDFMPLRNSVPCLIRIVTGLRGSVKMKTSLRLRFGYGRIPPWIEMQEGRVVGRVGPDTLLLDAEVPLDHDGQNISAEFSIEEGDSRAFVLQYADSCGDLPGRLDPIRKLAETEAWWRDWIGHFSKPTNWPAAVRRSLITIKALINRPTGGIVAAPTTSIPEVAGGKMNWDYRYCWLRDSAFAITALLNAGYKAEAKAWRDWILRAAAGTPEHLQVMYRLDGGRDLNEWTAGWLSGYRCSKPVRVGNAAVDQRQIDVYGELIDAMDLADQAGIQREPHGFVLEQAIIEKLERVWREPGHNLWESRGEPRRYVYSQVMAWAAIDRFLRRTARGACVEQPLLQRLLALRTEIHQEVCREGFDSGLESFVQYYGGHDVDASLLLIPSVRFLPANDPRITTTVERIEHELIQDGLLYRSSNSKSHTQGAFLACSCWLADCRQLQGRAKEARQAFERVLTVCNDVWLLSEEYDLRSRRLIGNFPQALSHIAVVSTGLGLSGPVLQRGGG